MTEFYCLAYFIDPFNKSEPLAAVADGQGGVDSLTLEELSSQRVPLVTYDPWRLVDVLRNHGLPLPACLIDLGDALKLLSGRSRDQGGERYWSVWTEAREAFDSPGDADIISALIDARVKNPGHSEVVRLLNAAAGALQSLWHRVQLNLEDQGEARRFFEVEVPVQQIFLFRQHQGLVLDSAKLTHLTETAQTEKYDAYQKLAGILGFSPDSLNYWNVAPFLEKTDAKDAGKLPEGSLEEYFRMIQGRSVFASTFRSFVRAKQSHLVLIRIQQTGDRLHPVFACFGTVTGRIRVAEPPLQELPKRYRGIFRPERGKSFRYVDFAQFEPGILAERAADPEFLRQYNSVDLYTALSKHVFGDESRRRLCKLVFLAYCYGMSKENIAKLLAGSDGGVGGERQFDRAIEGFFAAFPALENYRRLLVHELEANGSVATLMGNRRVRTSEGPLTYKEQRWAISQAIQGSASLIFKWSLLGLARRFGPESIVLPMHDAVLMQFDDEVADSSEASAREIMSAAFTHWCPSVLPRVVTGDFAP